MFTGNSRFWFCFVLIVFLSACQPATTTADTPSPEPTLPPLPTSTFTPVPPQETATPIPTANFTLEDLLGIWRHDDFDRGTLFLVFLDDGTYRASHGSPDVVIHSGSFTLTDRVITFIDGWEECAEGTYVTRISGGGKYLLFEPLDDKCPDRVSALKSIRWDRVEPTPTP